MPNKMQEVAGILSLIATNAQLLYGAVFHIVYTSGSSYLIQDSVILLLLDPPVFTAFRVLKERMRW